MTAWNKIANVSTKHRKKGGVRITTQSGKLLTTQGGVYLTRQGYPSTFADIADVIGQWGRLGGLVKLVTEGLREKIMTEGNTNYIVVSHGEDLDIWTDEADKSSVWTKVI